MEERKDCYVDVDDDFDVIFWRRRKTEKENEGNVWRRSLQKLSRIFRSLGFGLRLETFANFWRVSVSV